MLAQKLRGALEADVLGRVADREPRHQGLPGRILDLRGDGKRLDAVVLPKMQDRLFGPVFEPLRDTAIFNRVAVDEFGAITWPNGADLAPDALYERLRGLTEIAAR